MMIEHFRRLRELSVPFENSSESFFYLFWDQLYQEPLRVRAFQMLETELQVLDDRAWVFLRDEASKLAIHSNTTRGWAQLFEKLNEAKGYCHLLNLGCVAPSFIPREKRNNVETPDIIARLGNRSVLCEVKTINVSDELLNCRRDGFARNVENNVSPGLAAKLVATFLKAHSQLTGYETDSCPTRIVYFVINFDDEIDYREELNEQVHQVFNDLNCKDIEVAIHSEVAET